MAGTGPDVFQRILIRAAREGKVPAKSKQSREWFRKKAADMRVGRTGSGVWFLEKLDENRARSKVMPGMMYFFSYHPKHKDTLPYYDRLPLIIMLKKAKGGFYGFNLHYLPPTLRAKLMDALYRVASNKSFDEKTKLQLSWKIVNAAAQYQPLTVCIKRYLNSHVRSKFVKVESYEWDIAIMLPVAQFAKQSQRAVWRDTLRKLAKK